MTNAATRMTSEAAMPNAERPECVHDPAGDAACPRCGHGTPPRPVPAELAGWTRYETPPDIVERARREFDEAEYLAQVREIERTGGVQIDDLIAELERRVDGGS